MSLCIKLEMKIQTFVELRCDGLNEGAELVVTSKYEV